DIDVADARSHDDVGQLAAEALKREVTAAEGRLLAVRVRLMGATGAHRTLVADSERTIAEIRAAAAGTSDDVWVERVELATAAAVDAAEHAQRDDALGELIRSVRALRGDDAALAELAGAFAELSRKLPAELREGEDGLRLTAPAEMRRRLDQVEQ